MFEKKAVTALDVRTSDWNDGPVALGVRSPLLDLSLSLLLHYFRFSRGTSVPLRVRGTVSWADPSHLCIPASTLAAIVNDFYSRTCTARL